MKQENKPKEKKSVYPKLFPPVKLEVKFPFFLSRDKNGYLIEFDYDKKGEMSEEHWNSLCFMEIIVTLLKEKNPNRKTEHRLWED